MRLVFIVIFFVFVILNASGQDFNPYDEFQEANKAYSNKLFNDAIIKYESILESNYQSPELYFNLGNAYFKVNKLAYAILNYERAVRMNNSNDDFIYNLEYARSKTIDEIEPIPTLFLIELLHFVESTFDSTGWSIAGILSIWSSVILLVLFVILGTSKAKKVSLALGVILIVISITSFILAFRQNANENIRNSAIIMDPTVYVKSSPDDSSIDKFILHEGTKVKVLDSIGNWQKIKLINGEVGWLNQEALEII